MRFEYLVVIALTARQVERKALRKRNWLVSGSEKFLVPLAAQELHMINAYRRSPTFSPTSRTVSRQPPTFGPTSRTISRQPPTFRPTSGSASQQPAQPPRLGLTFGGDIRPQGGDIRRQGGDLRPRGGDLRQFGHSIRDTFEPAPR